MAPRTATVLQEIVRTAAGAAAVATDRELLRRFAESGDQAAFAALFRRHSGMVLGVCRRTLANVQDAEDACQATFLVLARKAGTGRWQASLANWLYTTARGVAQNARVAAERRARRENRFAVPEAVQPVDRMTGRELLAALDEELNRLPSHYREPLILCYLQGLTRDEAAARLGVPPATLKSHLERGRKRLGAALTRRGCGAGAGLLALAATSTAEAAPLHLVAAVLAAVAGTAPVAVTRLVEGATTKGVVNKSVAAALLLAGTVALGFGLVSAKPLVARQPRPDASGPTAKAPPPAPAKPAADSPGPRLVSGRVLTPDGKPAGGAKLFAPARKDGSLAPANWEWRQVGVTDADGHFTISLSPWDKDFSQLVLVASLPNFGVDWLEVDMAKNLEPIRDVTLRLAEDLPIAGQVVNTEGRPVAGVSVAVTGLQAPGNDKLDRYLAEWADHGGSVSSRSVRTLSHSLNQIVGPTTTDGDGRFVVRGTGAERIVRLLLSGGGIVQSAPRVVTRRGFDPKPFNDALHNEQKMNEEPPTRLSLLYAPEFTYAAEPGKEVAGTVTDAATGAPIPGCRLMSSTEPNVDVGALSDARGYYRLDGLAKSAAGYDVSISPPKGTAYLDLRARVKDTGAYVPVRHDVRLLKGAVVTGRVLDKQTGKGVWAVVQTVALANNKFLEARPEYRPHVTDASSVVTDRDGRFRLAAIPGATLVMAVAFGGEELYGQPFSPYRPAVPDPDHKDLFQPQPLLGGWRIATADGRNFPTGVQNSVRVVDVKQSGETAADLFLDRGVTGKIAVLDPDGRPLSGASIAGLAEELASPYRATESSVVDVYSLDPPNPRILAIYHPGRKLGALVTVRGDEKEPVPAKLGPLGRLTGRLIGKDGKPLAGMEVRVFPAVSPDDGDLSNSARYLKLSNAVRPGDDKTRSDKDGRFTFDNLFPAVPFGLLCRKDGQNYMEEELSLGRTVRPGEALDLGNVKLTPGP
jgi:RNA polymerase sigma factor (sigma-70 family)